MDAISYSLNSEQRHQCVTQVARLITVRNVLLRWCAYPRDLKFNFGCVNTTPITDMSQGITTFLRAYG